MTALGRHLGLLIGDRAVRGGFGSARAYNFYGFPHDIAVGPEFDDLDRAGIDFAA